MTAFTPDVYVIVNGSSYQAEIDVTTLSITGGRSSNGYQPDPMVATFDLVPASGYLNHQLMNEVQIQVTNPYTSTAITLFFGYIQDINYNYLAYGNGVGQRRYSITAMDPTATLSFASFGSAPTITQDVAGAQIGQALSYWSYASVIGARWTTSPTTSPSINDTSGSTFELDAINPSATDSVGDFITETASQVNGCLYFNPIDQLIYFDGVNRRAGRTAYSLGLDQIRPDINLSQSLGMVVNATRVNRQGTDATNSNATSISNFGKRTFVRDTRLHSLTDAQTKAANYLTSFSNVSSGSVVKRWRPSTISVDLHNPELTDIKRSSLLNTFCGKTVDVTVPDPDTDTGTMVLNCYIEGWSWSFGPKQLTFTGSLSLITDSKE